MVIPFYGIFDPPPVVKEGRHETWLKVNKKILPFWSLNRLASVSKKKRKRGKGG